MTSDEHSFAEDLIKLDAALDREDYNNVKGPKETCSKIDHAIPLPVDPDHITSVRKPIRVKRETCCSLIVFMSSHNNRSMVA